MCVDSGKALLWFYLLTYLLPFIATMLLFPTLLGHVLMCPTFFLLFVYILNLHQQYWLVNVRHPFFFPSGTPFWDLTRLPCVKLISHCQPLWTHLILLNQHCRNGHFHKHRTDQPHLQLLPVLCENICMDILQRYRHTLIVGLVSDHLNKAGQFFFDFPMYIKVIFTL